MQCVDEGHVTITRDLGLNEKCRHGDKYGRCTANMECQPVGGGNSLADPLRDGATDSEVEALQSICVCKTDFVDVEMAAGHSECLPKGRSG